MRSFIAINLPQAIKESVDDMTGRLRRHGPPARWVAGENLHLTMKFLDEIRDDQVMPLRKAIVSVAEGLDPFQIRLEAFGVFPNERKARIFWVGIGGEIETLKTLARDIDGAVEPLDFEREQRPFSGHITLARFREPGPTDRLMRTASDLSYQSEEICIERIDLMRSVLSGKEPTYSILESIPLRTHN